MIPLCCLYFVENRKDKEEKDGKPHDACRVHGSFEVNKVAGNFHVTAGKWVSGTVHNGLWNGAFSKYFNFNFFNFNFIAFVT